MYAFSLQECSVINPATGLKVRLTRNEVWAADDPLVKALPHLFGRIPPEVRRTVDEPNVSNSVLAPVESAVAEPGVKRTVKRASTK